MQNVVVAIVGFALNFAVYVSEMIRSGIDAIDRGKQEAATALGFGKVKSFIKIIAPQVARHVLPVYKGEFIYHSVKYWQLSYVWNNLWFKLLYHH